MSENETLGFESNGLFDFLPTPPESTKSAADTLQTWKPQSSSILEKRPESPVLGYGSPPPDYDEEPSDFEDEIQGIMDREQKASSTRMDFDEPEDEDEEMRIPAPVASCMSSLLISPGPVSMRSAYIRSVKTS